MFKKCIPCIIVKPRRGANRVPRRVPIKPPPRSNRVSCVEFDITMCVEHNYCPSPCSICLFPILKVDAEAGPCVTHVFHTNCINEWLAYRIMEDQPPSCPNCLMEYKQYDE